LEKTGSIDDRIAKSVVFISAGQKNLHIKGSAEKGQKIFHRGMLNATDTFKDAFKDAAVTKDPKIIWQSEKTFLLQKYKICDPSDRMVRDNLQRLVTKADDALRCLETMRKPVPIYSDVEKTYSTSDSYRVQSLPKDAFHNSCNYLIKSLENTLRDPDKVAVEKNLTKQRVANIKLAKEIYIELQKEALGLPANAKVKDNERER
jgi:hypothetical protein